MKADDAEVHADGHGVTVKQSKKTEREYSKGKGQIPDIPRFFILKQSKKTEREEPLEQALDS